MRKMPKNETRSNEDETLAKMLPVDFYNLCVSLLVRDPVVKVGCGLTEFYPVLS